MVRTILIVLRYNELMEEKVRQATAGGEDGALDILTS